jgi:WD40 repeat protein
MNFGGGIMASPSITSSSGGIGL